MKVIAFVQKCENKHWSAILSDLTHAFSCSEITTDVTIGRRIGYYNIVETTELYNKATDNKCGAVRSV